MALTSEEKKRLEFKDSCRRFAITSGILNYKEIGVYCFINERYNYKCDYSFPSHEDIRKKLNISEPTLNKILNSLEEKGFFTRKKGYLGRNTQYYLTLPKTEQNDFVQENKAQINYNELTFEEIEYLRETGQLD